MFLFVKNYPRKLKNSLIVLFQKWIKSEFERKKEIFGPCIYKISKNSPKENLIKAHFALCSVASVVSNSFATTRIVTHQAPLSVGIPRQEYCGVVPFPPL